MGEYARNFVASAVKIGTALVILSIILAFTGSCLRKRDQAKRGIRMEDRDLKQMIRLYDPAFKTESVSGGGSVPSRSKPVPPIVSGGDPWGRQW